MRYLSRGYYLASAAALALAACGGGGGDQVAFIPPPPVAPAPPAPPQSPVPFGVAASTSFPTVGDAFQISWDSAEGAYFIKFPGSADAEKLTFLADGSAYFESYFPPSSLYEVRLRKDLPYEYTKLANVVDNGWGSPLGQFAFGLATSAQSMPTLGSASYSAQLFGSRSDNSGLIDGSALLTFDFGAGKLSGYLEPVWVDPTGLGFESQALGRYTFVNTVYASGSTTFSGQLSNPNIEGLGSFEGRFNGPTAQEVMAQWKAQMIDPFAGQPVGISGVLIGKR